MAHTPFIKRSLLALSIAALSAPALVMAGASVAPMTPPAYNQDAGASGQYPAGEHDRSSTHGSPAGHTGGATSTSTMEPAGDGPAHDGMGAAGDTGTTGRGAGSGTTVIEDGPSGAGTTGTGGATGTGTMDRSGPGAGAGTMGTDDGMGTSTGTGTYGTGTGPGAMDRDSSFETDRNAPATTDDPMRDSRDNRNTTPDNSTGTLR